MTYSLARGRSPFFWCASPRATQARVLEREWEAAVQERHALIELAGGEELEGAGEVANYRRHPGICVSSCYNGCINGYHLYFNDGDM